jgi:hypothetical protein
MSAIQPRRQAGDTSHALTRVLDRTGETATMTPPATPWRLWQGRNGGALGITDELPTIQAMHESHLDALRERIAQSRYEVNPQAVAAAIIERLALGDGRRAAAASKPAH